MALYPVRLINIDVGLGDNLVFLHILPVLKKRYPHLIIGTAYPDVYSSHPAVKLIPCADSQKWCRDNVYKWMSDHQWKRPLLEAYMKMYNVSEHGLAQVNAPAAEMVAV